MSKVELLEQLIEDFDRDKLIQFYKQSSDKFRLASDDYSHLLPESDEQFDSIEQIGRIEHEKKAQTIAFFISSVSGEISDKDSKKKQYDIGKKILKDNWLDAGIFVFHGENNFRLSLIAASYSGPKRKFTTFKRYTYFVSPELTNKTFKEQLIKSDFSSIDSILESFSIEAVSNEFYNDFKPIFDEIVKKIKGDNTIDIQVKEDFALLFAIRVIFLGFVQKKGWLGDNQKFLQDLRSEYNQHKGKGKCRDEFYSNWLEPLFFQALKSPPGTPVEWGNNDFSDDTEKTLKMAPFLNGELFKRKKDVDNIGLYLPDEIIGKYFEFLFQYNFTIDESTAYDEEIELNPEFLGIIFEKFVNKEHGSVYTPRTEVDLMCRLSLLRWLERKNEFDTKDLYYLFFREGGAGVEYEQDQKYGNFSANEIRNLLGYLESVTICDPAAGSGAFEVGMLQVINDLMETIYTKMSNFPEDVERKDTYECKKDIIAKSLYGVEVQGYAVWINQLRLWLTLLIYMPDEFMTSLKPLLPSLNFKIRRGDSIVQRIGNKMFPVHGQANVSNKIKKKIRELSKAKLDFFYNRGQDENFVKQLEYKVFQTIIHSEIEEIDKLIELRNRNTDKGASGSQTHLLDSDSQGFGGQKNLTDEANSDENNKKAARDIELENQKQRLLDELENLQQEHPLIWNIEFSEIFYNKGGFDIIIGNPPYVPKGDIADPEGKEEPKEYKKLLKETASLDFSDHFKNRKIKGNSDLYTFFYVRTLHLLSKEGVHCFICSNSWLDVGYGVWLQEFLLENVPINMVIDNHARRSFASSDVNTVITLFDAPVRDYNKNEQLTKFVAFKKPFEECIFTEPLLDIHQAEKIAKNDIFRVYPITVENLYDEGWKPDEKTKSKHAGKYIGDKWGGKYLRAPDIFFTILKKGEDKFIKIKDFAEVNEGKPTGDNNYFFIMRHIAKKFKIEKQYLRNGIMKTRAKAFETFNDTIIERSFLQLPRDYNSWKNKNAGKYITYGEKQVKPKSKTLKSKKVWWYFKERQPADLLSPCGVGDKFFCAINNAQAISSNSYVELRVNDKSMISYIHRCINHPVGWLQLELLGRQSLGGGLLKTDPIEFRKFLFINNYPPKRAILNRAINSIFVECGIDPQSDIPIKEQEPKPLPDRKELDDIVFAAIGLTEEERKDVYRAVCRLVWNRISKAKSVKKRK